MNSETCLTKKYPTLLNICLLYIHIFLSIHNFTPLCVVPKSTINCGKSTIEHSLVAYCFIVLLLFSYFLCLTTVSSAGVLILCVWGGGKLCHLENHILFPSIIGSFYSILRFLVIIHNIMES